MIMYQVGGAVRDEILGVPSKDIDFTVVLDENDIGRFYSDPFAVMVFKLKKMGFKIFKEDPEYLTARAQFPKGEVSDLPAGFVIHSFDNLTADFVLARKESDYTDGRRPDVVVPGTLEDDLARRDFTMNAIAKDAHGTLIDPHDGRTDIARRVVRAVGDPRERLREDPLRAVRAVRFAVTKGFSIEGELEKVIRWDNDLLDSIAFSVSDERIREELNKMFAFNTIKTLNMLERFPTLTGAMFTGSVSLEATMKKRKGK